MLESDDPIVVDDNHDIEVEMRTIDEFGQECKMLKTFRIDGTENGLDADFLYEQFIYFMRMCGYSEDTIAHVQWVENEGK